MPDKKEDFIAIFKAESEDHLTKLDRGIVELEKNPDNLDLVNELNREAHTLKGAARVFGYYEIQEIAHKIEDIFDKVAKKKLAFNSLVANRVLKGIDVNRAILRQITQKDKIDIDISQICRELEECIYIQEDGENRKEKSEISYRLQRRRQSSEDVDPQARHTNIEEYIRVPLSRVNKLLNLVGELIINKMSSSTKINQAKRISGLTKGVQRRISELGERIKKEPSCRNSDIVKLLGQCDVEIERLREASFVLYDNVSFESFRVDPVIDELQAKIKEIRMLPLSTILEGFPRMIRDIALQQGKEINLEISGEDTELDKKVLEIIKVPLIHILRNCVDHGIETPKERERLGKAAYGTVNISASYETGNVIISIEDDGRGMDIEDIKQTALRKHLLSEEELRDMTEREILNVVFMNGYSTSPIITDISGRGIGLDIVRREIENLKGQVILDTQKNRGTRFTLILPLTIAIIQVLLVKSRGMLFAFPITSISEGLRLQMSKICTIEGRMAIQVGEHTVPMVRLSEVLKLPEAEADSDVDNNGRDLKEKVSVVIAFSLEKRVGFIVDEIIGEEEVFIKNLGEHLGKVNNVSGVSILGRGEIVIILDVADLIANSALSHPAVITRGLPHREKKGKKRILIVEDTLSTRELEKNILETQGYLVDTAVDGLDALNRVTQVSYDLIIADIQMPRMDGFEFCRTIKKNEKYKDIPIVIVTALENDDDKRKGIEVGAAAYIIKSAFDQSNLLDTVDRLIG